MYTYGVGSLVDLPNFSVVVAGLDGWSEPHQAAIQEERLRAAVNQIDGFDRVAHLRSAPWMEETRNPFDDWARVGVPVYPFPRWLRCTACNQLSTVDGSLFKLKNKSAYRPDLARYMHENCAKSKYAMAVPARFITACPNGHLDEFPWMEYVHQGGPCPGNPRLRANEMGSGTRSTDIEVECLECGAKRHISQAFGKPGEKTMPRCRGRHPHLRRFDGGGCDQQAKAMLLGASNEWFPVTRSVLSIPVSGGVLEQLVADHWAELSEIENADELKGALRFGAHLKVAFAGKDADDVWAAIESKRAGGGTQAETDLLGPEYAVLTDPANAPQGRDFKLSDAGPPVGWEARLVRVVKAERIREVVTLLGFTRVEGPDMSPGEPPSARVMAPISSKQPTWLPAAEVRGEGLFFQLSEQAVTAWVDRVAGTERPEAIRIALKDWRASKNLDASIGWPGERYLLLHTLSHAIINELALECGYSAASIRERIYAREAGDPRGSMAGIFIYTSAPDAEGTLGGLIGLGDKKTMGRLLDQAVERALLCSGDPLCSSHVPSPTDISMHAAACHACLFLPETSCERGNRFLDRAALVDVLGSPGINFV
jgi:hypothetical protein